MRYTVGMDKTIAIVGAGLAGTEAALQLASRGFEVSLYEMRPHIGTPVHTTGRCAELVCSNSLKSTKPESAAGMLKAELLRLGSFVYAAALKTRVAAGGALAVDRDAFSSMLDDQVRLHPNIKLVEGEVESLRSIARTAAAMVVATGPLTTDALAADLSSITGSDRLSFFDAAAPIVMADSIDYGKVFRQSRYEDAGEGSDGRGITSTRRSRARNTRSSRTACWRLSASFSEISRPRISFRLASLSKRSCEREATLRASARLNPWALPIRARVGARTQRFSCAPRMRR